MIFIFEGIKKGALLLWGLDGDVFAILELSLFVSLFATLIAVLIGVPTACGIALSRFRLKRLLIALINTGMGLPPVVVGLFVMLLLCRNGPLSFLHWLYTPMGMVLAQVIIAIPVVTGLTLAAVQGIDLRLYQQMLVLGASKGRALWVLLGEIRLAILAAIIAGFGSVISEVGAVMMVGGNIKNQTRVLTTATVLETNMGNYATAIALGMILLLISFIINFALTFIQQQKARGI